MSTIKNLLFDLGGVIIDLDRQRCVDALGALGMKDAGDFLGLYGQKGDFLALERGEIDAPEFYSRVRRLMPDGVSDTQIRDAFNMFLTGIPVRRLEALRRLRDEGYGIYLLSNTNPVMMESKIADEFRKEGLEMKDYFDGTVCSYEAKCYKPEPEIFSYTARHCAIRPEETLFLDDSQANVDAAKREGFNAVHVPPGSEFTDILTTFLQGQAFISI